MLDIVLDALVDSARMVPFLLVIYIGIELIENKLGDNLINKVKNAGKIAPILGAAFGLVPQCGFSVMATALYTKKVISLGTLLSVYISTSDEALPIILAHPEKLDIVFPLFATKFFLALVAGYGIDFALSRVEKNPVQGELCATSEQSMSKDNDDIGEKGCCGHSCHAEKLDLKEVILHPVIHTFKVFLFIFSVTLLINLIIFRVGEENLSVILLRNTILQPIITSIFGLLPNCASSIAITEVFLRGGLSFGSTVAGLSAGAGLGILILFRENHNLRDNIRIVSLLVAISSCAGIIIQYVYG